MSNPRRDFARLRTRKPPAEAREELPTVSRTSRTADVISLQRYVGNRGMQSIIAQGNLTQIQMPGGNRSRSTAIQRSNDPSKSSNEDDRLPLSKDTFAQTDASSVQREYGYDWGEDWGEVRSTDSALEGYSSGGSAGETSDGGYGYEWGNDPLTEGGATDASGGSYSSGGSAGETSDGGYGYGFDEEWSPDESSSAGEPGDEGYGYGFDDEW
jgi:hypothetical protein